MIKFLEEYYRATNRKFSDKFIWSPKSKDYERAWQKGQGAVSKTERLILIIFQYFCLIGSIVLAVIKPEIWWCALVGLGIFVLNAALTKFSFVWVFFLALALKRKNIYSKILYDNLFKDTDLSYLTKMTKKHISGYACIDKRLLRIKYKGISKFKKEVFLIFKPNSVLLVIDKKRLKFSEKYEEFEELLREIGNAIFTIVENNLQDMEK